MPPRPGKTDYARNRETQTPTVRTSQGDLPVSSAILLVGLDEKSEIQGDTNFSVAEVLRQRLRLLTPGDVFFDERAVVDVEQTVAFDEAVSVTVYNCPPSLLSTGSILEVKFIKASGGEVGPYKVAAFGNKTLDILEGFTGVKVLSDPTGTTSVVEARSE